VHKHKNKNTEYIHITIVTVSMLIPELCPQPRQFTQFPVNLTVLVSDKIDKQPLLWVGCAWARVRHLSFLQRKILRKWMDDKGYDVFIHESYRNKDKARLVFESVDSVVVFRDKRTCITALRYENIIQPMNAMRWLQRARLLGKDIDALGSDDWRMLSLQVRPAFSKISEAEIQRMHRWESERESIRKTYQLLYRQTSQFRRDDCRQEKAPIPQTKDFTQAETIGESDCEGDSWGNGPEDETPSKESATCSSNASPAKDAYHFSFSDLPKSSATSACL
jgi:hypothetical protein